MMNLVRVSILCALALSLTLNVVNGATSGACVPDYLEHTNNPCYDSRTTGLIYCGNTTDSCGVTHYCGTCGEGGKCESPGPYALDTTCRECGTCESLRYNCTSVDQCGRLLNCPNLCNANQRCGTRGKCVPANEPVTALTCGYDSYYGTSVAEVTCAYAQNPNGSYCGTLDWVHGPAPAQIVSSSREYETYLVCSSPGTLQCGCPSGQSCNNGRCANRPADLRFQQFADRQCTVPSGVEIAYSTGVCTLSPLQTVSISHFVATYSDLEKSSLSITAYKGSACPAVTQFRDVKIALNSTCTSYFLSTDTYFNFIVKY